jgi:hypothetical protein
MAERGRPGITPRPPIRAAIHISFRTDAMI